uniref:Uncharacterized protein n=1 Tax=Megaselia scalaris TaxID=36166 RepID=T1H3B4_MEGSC
MKNLLFPMDDTANDRQSSTSKESQLITSGREVNDFIKYIAKYSTDGLRCYNLRSQIYEIPFSFL